MSSGDAPNSVIARLVAALRSVGAEPMPEEVADALWLARYLQPATPAATVRAGPGPTLPRERAGGRPTEREPAPPPAVPSLQQPPLAAVHAAAAGGTGRGGTGALAFRSPAAAALPGALGLARALRPLMRRVPSPTRFSLDEEGTVERFAETRAWLPVLRPAPVRWLDVALVVDESPSMAIWQRTVVELRRLLERHGAFRDVRTWGLVTDAAHGPVELHAVLGPTKRPRLGRPLKELHDPSGRRLILVVTDATASGWYDGRVNAALASWGGGALVTIVQVLPERLWIRTALGEAVGTRVHAPLPGTPNSHLLALAPARWLPRSERPELPVPVVPLEPAALARWARMVAGAGDAWATGCLLDVGPSLADGSSHEAADALGAAAGQPSARERVSNFHALASPLARKLAGLLALAPLTLPVMRLVQQTMLPESRQVHLAEVFLSDLLEAESSGADAADPDAVPYRMDEEVRTRLLDAVPADTALEVLKRASAFVQEQAGKPATFAAWLEDPTAADGVTIEADSQPFAAIGTTLLRRLGGAYVGLAQRLEAAAQQAQPSTVATTLAGQRTAGPGERGLPRQSPSTGQPTLTVSPAAGRPQGDQRGPFVVHGPVAPERFYGRRKEIEALDHRLSATGTFTALTGLPRSGKTSLLLAVLRRAERQQAVQTRYRPVVVYLDGSAARDAADLFEQLRQGLASRLGTAPWSSEENDAPRAVSQRLARLREEGWGVVALLDEFDRLTALDERSREQLVGWWQEFSHAAQLTLCVASVRPAGEIERLLPPISTFADRFGAIPLGALELPDWHDLVRDGLATAAATVDAGDLEWIDRMAGGLPYFTQVAAATLLEQRTTGDRDAAYARAVAPAFRDLWDALPETDTAALQGIVGASGMPPPLPEAVSRLADHGILRAQRGLFSEPFADFVRRRIDYTLFMLPVREQGQEGSSVGFSSAAALEYQLLRRLGRTVTISPRHIYYAARERRRMSAYDAGANIDDTLTVFARSGVVAEEGWPYRPGEFDKPPPPTLAQQERFRIVSSQKLTGLDSMRAALRDVGPIVVGLAWYSSFFSAGPRKSGELPFPTSQDHLEGGHAVLVVGYDDDREQLKFRNSWGEVWGDGGYGYLPYGLVAQLVQDAWAITGVAVQPPRAGNVPRPA